MSTNLIMARDVGSLYQNPLSNKLRTFAQSMQRFRQLARPEADYSANMGTGIRLPKMRDIVENAQILSELGDVPMGTLTFDEFTIEWEELGFAVGWTKRAEIITELNLPDAIMKALSDHAARELDKYAARKLLECPMVYTPTGGYSTPSGSINTTGAIFPQSRPFSMWDLRNVTQAMKEKYRVPSWTASGEYLCICTPSFKRGLSEDPEYVDKAKRADAAKLLRGEFMNIEGVRFIEETNVMTGAQAIFMGDDALVELETRPLHFQQSMPQDQWGRDKKIGWFWSGGFETPWKFAQDGTTRIIRVDSL